MNVSGMGQAWLKAEDVKKPVAGKVERVTSVVLDGETRVVMHISGLLPLVLNTTNLRTAKDAWGPETDDWEGRAVKVASVPCTYMGRPAMGVRVTCSGKKPAAPSAAEEEGTPF